MIELKGLNGWAEHSVVQLLYRSRSLIGSGSVLQLSGILAEARPANARDDITGALTAVDGVFVQVIEGREAGIDALMARLARDSRHTDVEVLERRRVERRAFSDWDMVSPRLAGWSLTALTSALEDGPADLDAVIPILAGAIAHQEDVLEGRSKTPQAEMRRALQTPFRGASATSTGV